MRKIFSLIGIMTLLCLSFFYTEKIASVVKEYDDIMIQIKQENDSYKKDANNAIIMNNTIIPGISGKEINIDKTYSKMKRYGKFNSHLIVYQNIEPTVSIKNNLDKYIIGGNTDKLMVSLIFLVEKNDDIKKVLEILDKNKIKSNFFVDGNWLEDNNELLVKIINDGHNVGNLSYNRDYSDSSYPWADTIIKKIGKQEFGYCYNEVDDSTSLKLCSLYHNYTIRPNVIIKNNPLKETQEKVKSGSIVSFEITNALIKDLDSIIKYIESKGLTISTLNEHLNESNN